MIKDQETLNTRNFMNVDPMKMFFQKDTRSGASVCVLGGSRGGAWTGVGMWVSEADAAGVAA